MLHGIIRWSNGSRRLLIATKPMKLNASIVLHSEKSLWPLLNNWRIAMKRSPISLLRCAMSWWRVLQWIPMAFSTSPLKMVRCYAPNWTYKVIRLHSSVRYRSVRAVLLYMYTCCAYVIHWIPPLPIGLKWNIDNNSDHSWERYAERQYMW